jgi:hypothetical protein
VPDDRLEDLRAIADPIQRGRSATELIDDLTEVINEASAIRQDALEEVRGHMTPSEIAKAFRLTRARVSQLMKSPAPERALLAPEHSTLATIYVVQKRETERGRGSLVQTTATAVTKLEKLADELGVKLAQQDGDNFVAVPPPGLVDLNQYNLIVLMGPRTSALVAQAISSDPVIRWHRTERNDWYIVDSKTGEEYYSEFDEGTNAGNGERSCIAHIGRIRRPDGQGSFLYLGGAHAPGTAGAVDYFVREVSAIWEQAKRSLWSAVVVTKADAQGHIVSMRLATPIYVHGKR